MKRRHDIAAKSVAASAFTLVEVMLAVVIITGLLSVVLFFYQQASQLRTDLLQETERISAARLLMDRITTELRCARAHSYYEVPLAGDATSVQFITVGLLNNAAWTGEKYGRISRPETDLKFVRYGAAAVGEESTNVVGISRSEEPLVTFRTVISSEIDLLSSASTSRSQFTLLTEQLRLLRFRYWDGTAWQESWSDTRLPAAVEITLGRDALVQDPEALEVPAMPEDTFRRVVFLPGSTAPAPQGTSSDTDTTDFPEVPL